MNLKFELEDASPDDVKRLLGFVTPASQSYAPPVQVQDVSSSIETQAMLRELGILKESFEAMMQAQQNQLPSRTQVIYSQPQLSAAPDFPVLPPAPIPAEAPRYQTQPLAQTIVQEPVVEVEGYKVPAWFDKLTSVAVPTMAGIALAAAGLNWWRSSQPAATQKLTPPTTANQKSGNVLAVPDKAKNPPSSDSKDPPPIGVLQLPAVK